MTGRRRTWVLTGAGVLAYLIGTSLLAVADAAQPSGGSDLWPALIALPPALVLGVLVSWRRPDAPVGPALVWVASSPCLTWAAEAWGTTYQTGHDWPAAHLGAAIGSGVWVFNLTGFALLCLVFPDGLLAGRGWRLMPWAVFAVSVLVNALVSLDYLRLSGGSGSGAGSVSLLDLAAGVAFLSTMALAVSSLVVRYRRGDELTRTQLRWLVLGAGAVPPLLALGWLLQVLGAPVGVAYLGFLAAMLLVLPAGVALAILRYDLLDIDRLLTQSIAWASTTVTAAGVFAAVALGLIELGHLATDSRIAITGGAFVAALVALPLHERIHHAVARVVDRDRMVTTAALQAFVQRVRDGESEPEEVQDVLRQTLDDPELQVLIQRPGASAYVDLTGAPVGTVGDPLIPLVAQGRKVGGLLLGRDTARRRRRARDAAVAVRLPIEVSRLRWELRDALSDATASRSRLVHAVTEERRRLERDLHDGAQQGLVAVGMRLRSAQRRLTPDDPTYADLDDSVRQLETLIVELRRLAHGVRPSRLDDGLGVAIGELAATSPIPVAVEVDQVDVTDVLATTAYYVVSEGLANTLKHAGARSATVRVCRSAGRLTVEVADDGCGGARWGSGLSALRDRVTALGGQVMIMSPADRGTTVRAEF